MRHTNKMHHRLEQAIIHVMAVAEQYSAGWAPLFACLDPCVKCTSCKVNCAQHTLDISCPLSSVACCTSFFAGLRRCSARC